MRLTDEHVAEIRTLHAKGMGASALADRFGVSRSYVYDVVAGRARAGARVAPKGSSGEMTAAVEEFVAGVGGLEGRRAVLAAGARALARRLDALAGLDSAAGAMAEERIVGRLQDVLVVLAPDESEAALARVAEMLRPLRGAL